MRMSEVILKNGLLRVLTLSDMKEELADLFEKIESRAPPESFQERIALIAGNREYIISHRPPAGADDAGYVLCVLSALRPLEGESWIRSRDVADGPANDAFTWAAVNNRIRDMEALMTGRYLDIEEQRRGATIQ